MISIPSPDNLNPLHLLDLVAVILLAAGGVLGGELVHKHGVTLKPDQAASNHAGPNS